MIWTRMMIRAVVLMIQKVRGIVKFIWLKWILNSGHKKMCGGVTGGPILNDAILY